MSLDFKKFNTGTLFLVRTPDTFPVGHADKSFCDMKNNLHFDYAALLETWNCDDGVLWKTDKFPRSSYWKDEERDPVEECFCAADKYTKEAWKKKFGTELPTPDELTQDKDLLEQSYVFQMECFLDMYNKLAKYLKAKYNLPLMHYPLGIMSQNCYFQPGIVAHPGNVSIMNKVKELDLLNVQIHPPLNPNPYFYKLETEFTMGNAEGMPCVADTHFYHECSAGRLPDATPKRYIDNILSTVTPNGISFFCYGFMAEELTLWKKELNPGAPVYKAYQEPHTVKARREYILKGMNYIECLRPLLEGTAHSADCAIYFPESIGSDYLYGSYPIEHIFGLHELFNAAGIPVKIASKVPSHKDEQKMIIFDSVLSLPEEDVASLEKYIASGGQVMIIGKCCDEIEKLAKINVKHSTGTFIRSENSRYFNHYRDFKLASWWKNYFIEEKLCSGVEYHNVYIKSTDSHQYASCDVFKNDKKQVLLIRNYGVEQRRAYVNWDLPADLKVTGAWADGVWFEFKNNEDFPKYEHFVAICAEIK